MVSVGNIIVPTHRRRYELTLQLSHGGGGPVVGTLFVSLEHPLWVRFQGSNDASVQ